MTTRKALSTATTVMTILSAVVVAWSVIAIRSQKQQTDTDGNPTSGALPALVGTPGPVLTRVRYNDASATIVFALNSTCPFCLASMPAIRELTLRKHGFKGRLRTAVVGTESVAVLQEYLRTHAITVDDVRSLSSGVPLVEATPRTVLIGRDGTIVGEWLGTLRSSAPVVEAIERVQSGTSR